MKITAKQVGSAEIAWHVPPIGQGQTVEYAYGADPELGCFKRRTDRSDGSVTYYASEAAAGMDEGAWQPWNGEPACSDWVELE